VTDGSRNVNQPLPIDPVLPQVIDTLRTHSCVVLRAPTGAGKTTRVPPALLDAGLAGQGGVLLLEPRRLAARAAARRMAAERCGRLGDEIGYQVRFDRQATAATRLLVITSGLLPRFLASDPFLEKYSILLFDEFHERSLDSDLALGLVRLIQKTVRPELRIIIMSATLAVERLAAYVGGCPIIAAEGRQFPVDIEHRPRPERRAWSAGIAEGVRDLLDRTDGDILVFLPGLYEIRQAARQLEALAEERELAVLPLHGDLPAEQQDAALLPQERRKVVLATNVAETSVTIEGITGVVDTGLARLLSFDPALGLNRLEVTPISRASADQRTGRAGRTRPGLCIRLWSASAHRARPEQTEPEIRRVDLAGAVLQLFSLHETDVARFPWPEPPREAFVQQALALLRRLGAIDDTGLTSLGDALARLPIHPRLGRLLVEGQRRGDVDRAALAAALLAERDPFIRSTYSTARHTTASDVLDRVEALEEFAHHGRTETPLGTINRGAARFVLRARDQLLRLLASGGRQPADAAAISGLTPTARPIDVAFLRSLLAAFPDRLARRREPGTRRGVMMGGRGVRLAPSSGVIESELFLCIDVDAAGTEALVRQASAVQRDWLPPEGMRSAIEVAFEAETERVTARHRLYFEDLLLEESPAALPDNEQTSRVLADAAIQHLDRVMPAGDSSAGTYLTRIRCLRDWLPELELPLFDESALRELVTTLCLGCRSFADLRDADWLGAIRGQLTHAQWQALEREAPERLQVPSGSRIALRYETGSPPILAIRIQEVFGWPDTPRIAAGRVRVLLHLLAPNYRPQQVTDDLASFWANTYPQVRKELRARYPKHAWPENPLEAVPERRPRR
jgi:ATP-dependent helicase HrpB